MKIIVKEKILCKDIKKHLPKCYCDLFPTSFGNEGQYVNMIVFPYDRKGGVITSRYIQKGFQKIKDPALLTVCFAWCFSVEAESLIKENNGLIFNLNDFEWTDESWFKYKNG